MPAKPGDRVVAMMDADDKTMTVRVFGFGVYVGDEVPDADAGGLGDVLRSVGLRNPKIVLDSGTVVWGCECWWGHERVFHERYADWHIVAVDIKAERARHAEVAP